jgi:hypothetical protein
MTSPPNITNITPPRVPFVDDRTGLISREWYRFLLNLFTLTGSGQSAATLEDLQLVPSPVDYTAEIAAVANIAEIGTQPPVIFGTLAYQNSENAFVTRLNTVSATTGVRNGTLAEDSGFVTLLGTNGAITGIGTTAVTVTQATGFRPFASNTYNLGTSGQRWASTYSTEFLAGPAQEARYKEDSGFALVAGDNGVVTAIGTTGITVTQATGFRPFLDNTYDLGTSGQRWDTVYAAVGTINTSDATEKQQIQELTDAERRVAQRVKSLVRTFKWNSAVDLKGDAARTHVGVMAQDVYAAFAAEGLDANKYGLFCSDDIPNADGTVTARLGLRYDQLLTFALAAL